MPKGSFETLNRDMTGQLGRLKKLGQGLALAEPKGPKRSVETFNRDMTGQLGVEPGSLEDLRNWVKVGPSRTKKCQTAVSKPLIET